MLTAMYYKHSFRETEETLPLPQSFVFTDVTQECTITHNPTVSDIWIPKQIIYKNADSNNA